MKNKILSVILCLSVILSSGAAFAAQEDSISFETKVMRGLFVVDSDFETNPDDEVMRGDFVRILMDMINAQGESKLRVGGFKDLSTGASYSNAVIHAANMGYISGYGDGTFRASNPITPTEAVTMILKIAGYDMAAATSGGYSDGYLSLARSQNLLKGVSANINSPLTKRDVATLLYNAMSVEVYSLTSSTGDGSVKLGRNGELFMESFMDLTSYRGIITSNHISSLTGGPTCTKGEIVLGELNFDCSYEKAESYLGYRVEAYVKTENNDETLVFAIPYKTNVLEIKGEDITDETTDTLVYYEVENEARSKKVKVEAEADKIVNGMAEIYLSLRDVIFNCDSAVFIDNDDDGIYEVVFIYAYTEMYVGSVSASDETIYSKYTFDGALSSLDLESADEIVITKNGASAEFKDIKANDVISIIEIDNGGKRVVKIEASDKKISGVVTMIDTAENSIYVDNQEYKLSNLYNQALLKHDIYAKKIELSMAGTFYLNSFGRISVVIVDDTAKRYGFVKRAYVGDDLEMRVEFKILGTDGDWQIYKSADKINCNGKRITAEAVFKDEDLFEIVKDYSEDPEGRVVSTALTPQVVEFELNRDSQIKALNTAKELSNTREEFRYTLVSDLPYRSNNKSFESKTYISSNTVTFSIPTKYSLNGIVSKYSNEELAQVSDKYFLVNTGSVYSDGSKYSLKSYNCDKFGATELIVRETEIEKVGELSANNFLFNRLIYTVGSDGSTQAMIEGLHGTNISASAPISSDIKIYDNNDIGDDKPLRDLSYLSRGDLLKLYLDVDNNIYLIYVMYKAEGKKQSNFTNTLHSNEVLLSGYVQDIDHEQGFILFNDGATEPKSIRLYSSKISVYIYDTKVKKDSIRVGNINDIQKGSYLLMKGGQSSFDYIVIYE